MFTGIVNISGRVLNTKKFLEVKIPEKHLKGLKRGSSVSINGVCLSVIKINGDRVFFQTISQTLKTTNLADLRKGSKVNVERASKIGQEIGGHPLCGHIFGTVKILKITKKPDQSKEMWIKVPSKAVKYLCEKGFIGLEGCSLTVAKLKNHRAMIGLIPDTLKRSNLGIKKVGESLNLEIDPQLMTLVNAIT